MPPPPGAAPAYQGLLIRTCVRLCSAAREHEPNCPAIVHEPSSPFGAGIQRRSQGKSPQQLWHVWWPVAVSAGTAALDKNTTRTLNASPAAWRFGCLGNETGSTETPAFPRTELERKNFYVSVSPTPFSYSPSPSLYHIEKQSIYSPLTQPIPCTSISTSSGRAVAVPYPPLLSSLPPQKSKPQTALIHHSGKRSQ